MDFEASYADSASSAVTEGRPYAMEGTNGKTFTTDQYLVLTQGKQEKEFPMIACSQAEFTTVSCIRSSCSGPALTPSSSANLSVTRSKWRTPI